jgi:ChrR Cupin-like domain
MDEQTTAKQLNVSFIDGESTPWCASTFAPGVEVKDLGEANGRAMQLVRFPPGTVFPVHKHAGPEFVYILEGEMQQNGRRLGRGGRVCPPLAQWMKKSGVHPTRQRPRADDAQALRPPNEVSAL